VQEGIRRVFCDTSFFYAVIDSNDADHEKALSLSEWIKDGNLSAITTWEVVVETVTLLRNRLGYRDSKIFIDTVLPGLNIVYIGGPERRKALETFLKLGRDKKLSLCDVISYVVVKEHLKGIPCLAFDEDFRKLGLRVL
jgi:predicted nucleic acid-binding protein